MNLVQKKKKLQKKHLTKHIIYAILIFENKQINSFSPYGAGFAVNILTASAVGFL